MGRRLIDVKKYDFDLNWMIGVVERAPGVDPYLVDHPEILEFLLSALPKCKPTSTKLNPNSPENVKFYFDDSVEPTHVALFSGPNSIRIYGDHADLGFSISRKHVIVSVDVWLH